MGGILPNEAGKNRRAVATCRIEGHDRRTFRGVATENATANGNWRGRRDRLPHSWHGGLPEASQLQSIVPIGLALDVLPLPSLAVGVGDEEL